MGKYGKAVDVAAGIIALVAGVSLITTSSAASDSIFNPLLHGLGGYMVARGIWMIRHAGRQEAIVERLDSLIRAVKE